MLYEIYVIAVETGTKLASVNVFKRTRLDVNIFWIVCRDN